ncbi:MAG: hypothetical protein QOF48_757 [Verrucomicrobiota bacterium]|jgi:hypothetical protein
MTPDYPNSSRGGLPGDAELRPGVQENTLKTGKVQIERKTFVFSLRQNPRGRFLRITEDVGGRRDNIIIPATGLDEFRRMLEEMSKAADVPQVKEQQP